MLDSTFIRQLGRATLSSTNITIGDDAPRWPNNSPFILYAFLLPFLINVPSTLGPGSTTAQTTQKAYHPR